MTEDLAAMRMRAQGLLAAHRGRVERADVEDLIEMGFVAAEPWKDHAGKEDFELSLTETGKVELRRILRLLNPTPAERIAAKVRESLTLARVRALSAQAARIRHAVQ